MILPLRTKIVVTLEPHGTQTTASGLHLADSSTHLQWATVDAIGEDVTTVKPRDRVLVNVLVGQQVGTQMVLPDQAVIGVQV